MFISVLYNLLWFSVFIYFLFQYPELRVSLTLAFLLFYLLAALPLKDWFIHSIFFKLLYPDTGNVLVKDKRIKELTNKSDINRLLKVLIKELNINGLTMISNDKTLKQSYFYRDTEKDYTPVTQQDIEKISIHFQQNFRKSLNGPMPDDIKVVAEKYNFGGFVPVFYKSKYFGFFAITGGIDIKKITILEGLAGRIGLIMENDALTESAIKNESFKKEFTLARQIEKFLHIKETVEVENYNLSVDKNILKGVGYNFPVLIEKSKGPSSITNPYFIFCRISKSNPRMRTMLLFMVAGYFITHSKNCKNLQNLFKNLNESLFLNGPEFSIDGFLIQKMPSNHWRVNYFGKNVQIKCEGKNIDLNTPASLGSTQDKTYNCIDFKNKNEIVFCINQMPGIRIFKK
ncbi:MAG: hypothetical protein OEV78_07875 [Spirochaetia bacterium]|nr:hypothetical protein [Spirochaetia bacterium]